MGLSNQFIKEILESKITNELTKNTYITRMNKLSQHLGTSLYEILKNPKKYYPMITNFYKTPCSIRNNVNLVLSIFKYIPNLIRKKPNSYNEWKKKLDILSKEPIKEAILPITKQMIIDKYFELKKMNQHVLGLTQSMQYVLLSLIVNLKINKLQFNNLAIIFAPKTKSPSPNYIYFNNNMGFMKFNDHKYKLNDELIKDIKDSLKYHQRNYLFGFLKMNSFNVFVIRTFDKLFNHKIGVNTLSKILSK